MARLVSCRTPLSRDWRYLHRARLDILPVWGHSWFRSQGNATGFHVLNHCDEGLQLATKRNTTIQDLLESLLVKQRHDVTVIKAIPGQRLRPDLELELSGSRVMVDVVVSFDHQGSIENAYKQKFEKYSSLGRILPLVVGSLGSWYSKNDDTSGAFRFKARTATIQRSMDMVCAHFHYGAQNPEAEEIPPFPVEDPYPVD
jgi:hypothetical protein